MLTRNLATEWARHNIQVNGIGPGYIATPINTSYREPGNPLNNYIVSRTPAGRWGTPDDLIGAAIFLASGASDFVNGHEVRRELYSHFVLRPNVSVLELAGRNPVYFFELTIEVGEIVKSGFKTDLGYA